MVLEAMPALKKPLREIIRGGGCGLGVCCGGSRTGTNGVKSGKMKIATEYVE